MSKSLESQVWQSALDPELKPVAAVMADMGNNDGLGIYPSIEYIAWLLSRSERSIQTAIKKLVKLGVLDRVAFAKGGRGLTPRYKLDASKLPERPSWADVRKGATVAPFVAGEKGETNDVKGAEFSEKGANSAPDPLVEPLEIQKLPPLPPKRKKGYQEPETVMEPLYYYPPDDFEVTDVMMGWVIERQIDFTRSDILKLTDQWLTARRADLQRKGRTLFNWQNDWLRYVHAVWDKRQDQRQQESGHPSYMSPPKPVDYFTDMYRDFEK